MVAMAEVKTVMPAADAHPDEHKPIGDYWGDFPAAHAERSRWRQERGLTEPEPIRSRFPEGEP